MISGKCFSELCKWVVDPRYPERLTFSYQTANDGDWVFINGDYIQSFLNRIPFLSAKRFYVIIHNSDFPFTEEKLMMLRKHIYHVFAINTTFTHPRVTTVPIGFADNQLDFLSSFHPETVERDIEIYLNIKVHHNREKRGECIRAFENDPRVVNKERVSVPEYYNDLCRSKFVLCPEGTGIDTHRVYESILCGATPVVLRNSLSHLYEKLPVCIVDKWTDPFYKPSHKEFTTRCQSYIAL
jgi:hypothetical protein